MVLIIFIVTYLLFCAGCMKFRMSDKKAYTVFRQKNASLKICDTIIDGHHLHLAISGNDSFPTLIFVHGSPGSWSNYAE